MQTAIEKAEVILFPDNKPADYSDDWSEEDIRDLKLHTMRHAVEIFEADESLVDESTEWSDEDMNDVVAYSLSIADNSMDTP